MSKNPKAFIVDFLIVLVGFFLIIALTEHPTKVRTITIPTQGLYAIVQTCPPASQNDVDLYVRDPKGNMAFFYQTTAGLMHLEQDVIPGVNNKFDNVKVPIGDDERVIIRGVIPGEYIVNIEMYNRVNGPVTCRVSLWSIQNNLQLVTRNVTLYQNGDVGTAFRFTLDPSGRVTDINFLPRNIVFG